MKYYRLPTKESLKNNPKYDALEGNYFIDFRSKDRKLYYGFVRKSLMGSIFEDPTTYGTLVYSDYGSLDRELFEEIWDE